MQPGEHELELTIRPRVAADGDWWRAEIPILPSAAARLFVPRAVSLPELTVATARGMVRTDADGELTALLGPATRLSLRWRRPKEIPSATPRLRLLKWLHLRPETAELTLYLRWDVIPPAGTTLTLKTSPQLEPLDATLLASSPTFDTEGQRLISIRPDVADDAGVIRIPFQLTGLTGIGRIHVPAIEILNEPLDMYSALTADKRLSVQEEPVSTSEPVSSSDLAELFALDTAPEGGLRATEPQASWVVSSTPIPSSLQSRLQQVLQYGAREVRCTTLLELTVDGPPSLELKLRATQGLKIDRAAMVSGTELLPLTVRHGADEQWIVRFDRPRTGILRLILDSRRREDVQTDHPLPQVRPIDGIVTGHTWHVYRGAEVLVEIADGTGLLRRAAMPPELSPSVARRLHNARWVGSVEEQPVEELPKVVVRLNNVEATARTVNIVTREEGQWYQRLLAQVQVDAGELDKLSFEVPRAWVPGLQAELHQRIEFHQAPRPDWIRIALWPDEPIRSQTSLWLSGPIPVSPGKPLEVPDVRLLGRSRLQREIYVPVAIDGQPLLWSVQGLEPIATDETLLAELPANHRFRAYVATQRQFTTRRVAVNTTVGTPRVLLADVYLRHHDDRRVDGMVLFDVDPDGLQQCVVHFPTGTAPVEVLVDQVPVDLADRGADDIPILLQSRELPQRVAVLFNGRATWQEGQWRLAIPRLRAGKAKLPAGSADARPSAATLDDNRVPLPIERTLWTIVPAHPREFSYDYPTVTSPEQNQQRLERLTAALRIASQRVTDVSRDGLTRWYGLWGRRHLVMIDRFTHASKDVDAELSDGQPPDAAAHRTAHKQWAEQLNLQKRFAELRAERDFPRDEIDLWMATVVDLDRLRRYAFAGPALYPVWKTDASEAAAHSATRYLCATLGLVLAISLLIRTRARRIPAP